MIVPLGRMPYLPITTDRLVSFFSSSFLTLTYRHCYSRASLSDDPETCLLLRRPRQKLFLHRSRLWRGILLWTHRRHAPLGGGRFDISYLLTASPCVSPCIAYCPLALRRSSCAVADLHARDSNRHRPIHSLTNALG